MTLQELKVNAYNSFTHDCINHEGDCTVTNYYVATIMTYGSDKSHRLVHDHHTSDDEIYFDNSPGCGSKKWGSPHAFKPTPGERPTCGRC
jgi:hypothetical protein